MAIAQSGPRAGFPGSESFQADLLRSVVDPTPQGRQQRRAEAAAQVRWRCDWAADDRLPENETPNVPSNERPGHKGMNPARRARQKRNLLRRRKAAIAAKSHLDAAGAVPPRKTLRNKAVFSPR